MSFTGASWLPEMLNKTLVLVATNFSSPVGGEVELKK